MEMKDIQEFRDIHYTSENLLFAVVGDLTKLPYKQIEETLSKYNISSGTENRIDSEEPNLGIWEQPIRHDIEHTSAQACLGLWMPGLTITESQKLHFCDHVAYNMIGEGMHSLMFNRLREQLGLCYATGLVKISCQKNSLECAYALLDRANLQRASEEIKKIVQEVSKGEFTDCLLQTSRSNSLFSIAQHTQIASMYSYLNIDPIFSIRQTAPDLEGKYIDRLLRTNIEKCSDKELRCRIIQTIQKFLKGLSITTMNANLGHREKASGDRQTK